MNWPALPFVRLILPLVLGILLGIQPIQLPVSGLLLTFGSLLLSLFLIARRRLAFQYRRWYGVLLYTGLLVLGYLLTLFHTPRHHSHHLEGVAGSARYWQLEVREIKPGAKTIRLQGLARAAIDSAGTLWPVRGRVLIYLPPDSAAQRLIPGQQIVFRAPLEVISPPRNPHAFDFAAYMSKKGIYHRAFPQSEQWTALSPPTTNWHSRLYQLQQYCLRVLDKHLPDPTTLAVGAALIMGERDLISEEVRQAYTDTGAIHVLAVSGLHVGIIYLGLGWLLTRLRINGKKWRWPRSFLLLLSVWSFALFTGGSASVLRAASMFSFLIVGEALYRRHNIYNTLAASAFLLLCIQPMLLFDVGFQLSYLAVVGIVFFQGRIYRMWFIPHRAGDYLWKLASVSIAAQLTTLPISLFYFHQFPLYFWLSGWIVVPAALVILCLGLALLCLHAFPFLPDLLGQLLATVINGMNQLIFQIEQLPMALLSGIWLGSGVVLLLYAILINIMRGLHDRRLRPIQWALIGLIGAGCWFNVAIWQAERQQVITAYHIYGHTALDFFAGRTAYTLTDLPSAHPQLHMAAENHRTFHRIHQRLHVPLQDSSCYSSSLSFYQGYFQMADKTGLILESLPTIQPAAPIPIDFVLLRGNAKIQLQQLAAIYQPRMLIFDVSNYRNRIKQWTTECKQLGIPCHDISTQGAWIWQPQ